MRTDASVVTAGSLYAVDATTRRLLQKSKSRRVVAGQDPTPPPLGLDNSKTALGHPSASLAPPARPDHQIQQRTRRHVEVRQRQSIFEKTQPRVLELLLVLGHAQLRFEPRLDLLDRTVAVDLGTPTAFWRWLCGSATTTKHADDWCTGLAFNAQQWQPWWACQGLDAAHGRDGHKQHAHGDTTEAN